MHAREICQPQNLFCENIFLQSAQMGENVGACARTSAPKKKSEAWAWLVSGRAARESPAAARTSVTAHKACYI